MWLYFGKEFTAERMGSAIRDVTCEKCSCAYHYELARTGVGKGTSPYYLNNAGAAARADRRAADHLRKLLARDVEAVPCPQCGWIQPDMAQWLHGRHLRWMNTLAIAGGVVGLMVVFVIFLAARGDPDGLNAARTWLLLTIAISAALIVLRRALSNLHDPNRDFPRRPRRRPGTPPALVRVESEDTTAPARYVPAREDEQSVLAGEWVEVQFQRCVLPNACCACLAPADTAYRVPFCVGEQPMAAPLCRACYRGILRRWWAWALVSLVIAAALGALPLLLGIDEGVGQIFLAVIVFIFAAAFATAMLPEWRVRPYRVKSVDASRGIYRLRFMNPIYTETLAEMYVAGGALEPVTAAPPPLPPRGIKASAAARRSR